MFLKGNLCFVEKKNLYYILELVMKSVLLQ